MFVYLCTTHCKGAEKSIHACMHGYHWDRNICVACHLDLLSLILTIGRMSQLSAWTLTSRIRKLLTTLHVQVVVKDTLCVQTLPEPPFCPYHRSATFSIQCLFSADKAAWFRAIPQPLPHTTNLSQVVILDSADWCVTTKPHRVSPYSSISMSVAPGELLSSDETLTASRELIKSKKSLLLSRIPFSIIPAHLPTMGNHCCCAACLRIESTPCSIIARRHYKRHWCQDEDYFPDLLAVLLFPVPNVLFIWMWLKHS